MPVDDCKRKSNNWTEQWQSGKLGTRSRVSSFLRTYPSSNDVPVLLLNQPIDGRGRGSKRPIKLKQMYNYMKHNWNFNGGVWGAGVSEKSLSRGRLIWIFSETAEFHFETTIGDKIVETLYLTRVTSENKRIHE